MLYKSNQQSEETAEGVKKMSKYVKPVISLDEGMAEGVYAASGCYTAEAYIHQRPETGRGDYRIQVNGTHDSTHTREAQTLTISFNQNVTYVSGGAGLISGNGTTTLQVKLSYHQNPNDNIGLSDLYVTSDAGLAITGVSITD